MIKSHYGLQGQFKIDVYNKNDVLKYTTDYFDNFITPSGLNYPFSLAFADCFRYLTVGTGNNPNTILGGGTTGISSGFNTSGYSYIGGGKDSSCAHVTNKYYSGGCGYRIENSGATLFRAWRVPESTSDFFSGDTTVREYMLTPSRPRFSGLCGCDESSFSVGLGDFVYGKENHWLVDYYETRSNYDLCSATKAFTRVVKDISVAQNEYLVINYALTINYNTGIRKFSIVTTRSEGDYYGDVDNWNPNNVTSGIYSLVHPGIKLISDGTVNSVDSVRDAWSTTINSSNIPLGESFIPPLGDPMEPYQDGTYIKSYISNDGEQFLVNDVSGGGMPNNYYFPYNSNGKSFPSGVLAFHKNWITETTNLESPNSLGTLLGAAGAYNIWFFNKPRSPFNSSNYSSKGVYASKEDFVQSVTAASANISPYILESKYDASSVIKQVVTDPSERTRYITRSFQFLNPDITQTNAEFPVRSMVLCYTPDISSYTYFFPFIDACFAPISGFPVSGLGGGIMTRIRTGVGVTGYDSPLQRIHYTSNYNSGYNFMDGSNILEMQFKATWSSPCSSEVLGC